jgi:diamine N-acetyltransferase
LFQIRRGGRADAAALAELAERTFNETFGDDNTSEDLARHTASNYGRDLQERELTSPDMVTLLMESADGIAAFAQVRRAPAPTCVIAESPVELFRFYVDRPWHGRGLARPLMDAAYGAARELGGRTLWLGVWEKNPRAIAFYGKCGFRDVGSHDFWVGADLQVDRVMVTDLP